MSVPKFDETVSTVAACIELHTNAIVEWAVGYETVTWFRGQPLSAAGEPLPLIPRLYRHKPQPHEVDVLVDREDERRSLWERDRLIEFQQRAISRVPDAPGPDAYAQWLMLAQHHGLSTRMLDWTESVLVAAYFAASSSDDRDAEIVVFDPSQLVAALGRASCVVSPAEPSANAFAERAFGTEQSDTLRVQAWRCYEFNRRLLAQRGTFTVHDGDTPLESVDSRVRFLYRARVPASAKWKLLSELAICGITRSTLFQDLDSLAQELNETYGEWPRL